MQLNCIKRAGNTWTIRSQFPLSPINAEEDHILCKSPQAVKCESFFNLHQKGSVRCITTPMITNSNDNVIPTPMIENISATPLGKRERAKISHPGKTTQF